MSLSSATLGNSPNGSHAASQTWLRTGNGASPFALNHLSTESYFVRKEERSGIKAGMVLVQRKPVAVSPCS